MNLLCYGDNLDVLRRHVKDESVDLIYLDPPFKSNQDYNVLFAEQTGTRSAAQIKAFEDTWRWDQGAAEAYEAVVEAGGRLDEPTKPMRTEAAGARFYKTPDGNHPRLQILTIKQLLEGGQMDYPPQYARTNVTFKKAPKAVKAGPTQKGLPIAAETESEYGG